VELLTILSVTTGALAAVLVNIAIWAPRRLWIKLAALATAACFLPAAYAGFAELLGRPKPVELQWTEMDRDEATVLAAQMREGEAIYLWIGFEGLVEPRSFALPWNETMARQLHRAQGEAEETGMEVRARMPLMPSEDRDEPMFYAKPQAAPPPKTTQPDDAIWFQSPEASNDG